uniref:C2 domain-containing protein n=1 Tax=Globodera pallida TaxID=36090 RepID=A0A183BVP7_GLOPA
MRAFITNTSSPVSYIVRLEAKLVDVEPFEMENPQTRELFTLRRVYNDLWFLERGPVEREQSSWDLDRATLKCGWEEQQSVIKIAIYDDDDVG